MTARAHVDDPALLISSLRHVKRRLAEGNQHEQVTARVIPFRYTPPEKDPHLEEKLRAEWPGILRWMIDGCLDWQANRLIAPEAISATTETYFEEQDLIGQWLADECDVEIGNEHKTATSAELYKSWCDYAARRREDPGTQNGFSRKLKSKKLEPFSNRIFRGFKFVRVRPTTRFGDAL